MLHFGCPHCQQRLKVSIDKAEKLFRCAGCAQVIRAPKSLGQLALPDFAEECGGPEQRVFLPKAAESCDYLPDLTPEWRAEQKQTNLSTFVIAAGMVGTLGVGIITLVLVSRRSDPHPRPPLPSALLKPPTSVAGGKGSKVVKSGEGGGTRPAAIPPESEEDGASETVQLRPNLQIVPSTKPPPVMTVTQTEIDADHKRIEAYVRHNIVKYYKLDSVDWKGPWRAQDHERNGKMYRLTATWSIPFPDGKKYPKSLCWYFFLHDDAVKSHEEDPGDRGHLTICKALGQEPLTLAVVRPDGSAAGGMNVTRTQLGPVGGTEEDNDPVKKWERDNPERARRSQRWTLKFNTIDGADYVRQLAGLDAILAIPVGDGKFGLIRNLRQLPARGKVEDINSINLIRWTDANPDSVLKLAQALRLDQIPPYIIAFFPEYVEKRLGDQERNFAGTKEADIQETHFRLVKLANGRYDAQVTLQK